MQVVVNIFVVRTGGQLVHVRLQTLSDMSKTPKPNFPQTTHYLSRGWFAVKLNYE